MWPRTALYHWKKQNSSQRWNALQPQKVSHCFPNQQISWSLWKAWENTTAQYFQSSHETKAAEWKSGHVLKPGIKIYFVELIFTCSCTSLLIPFLHFSQNLGLYVFSNKPQIIFPLKFVCHCSDIILQHTKNFLSFLILSQYLTFNYLNKKASSPSECLSRPAKILTDSITNYLHFPLLIANVTFC